MFTLLAATFSSLKGTAIAVAAVNVAVIAAVLVCLFFLYRSTKKKKIKVSKSAVECTIMRTVNTTVKFK